MLELKASAAAEVTAGVFAFPAGRLCGPKFLAGHRLLLVSDWHGPVAEAAEMPARTTEQ